MAPSAGGIRFIEVILKGKKRIMRCKVSKIDIFLFTVLIQSWLFCVYRLGDSMYKTCKKWL